MQLTELDGQRNDLPAHLVQFLSEVLTSLLILDQSVNDKRTQQSTTKSKLNPFMYMKTRLELAIEGLVCPLSNGQAAKVRTIPAFSPPVPIHTLVQSVLRRSLLREALALNLYNWCCWLMLWSTSSYELEIFTFNFQCTYTFIPI